MNTLTIDPELTRQLAADLQENSRGLLPEAPALPDNASVSDFSAAIRAAFENLTARTQQLHEDLAHLSRSGFALADAAVGTDSTTATDLVGVLR